MSDSESEDRSKRSSSENEQGSDNEEENNSGSENGSGSQSGSGSASGSGDEGSQKDSDQSSVNSEEQSEEEVEANPKKKPTKFKTKTLSVAQAIQIDIIPIKEQKGKMAHNFLDQVTDKEHLKYTKKERCLELLKGINNDLDTMQKSLSNNIKNFDLERKSMYEYQSKMSPLAKRQSPVHSTREAQGQEHRRGNYSSEDEQGEREYKQERDREDQRKKTFLRRTYTEKETNTDNYAKTGRSYYDASPRKEDPYGTYHNRHNYKINNNNSYKSNNKKFNNHFRTVEDLYRSNKQPVLYRKDAGTTTTGGRGNAPLYREHDQKLKKKHYEVDSDHHSSGKF